VSALEAVDGVGEWLTDSSEEQRRRSRNALAISLLCHLALLVALWIGPPAPAPLAMPPAIQVELLASLPSQARPHAKEATAVPLAKPPPKLQPKLEVLPKRASPAMPRRRAKPRPKKSERVIRRQQRPKELRYEDALAKLRSELGEGAPDAPPAKAPQRALEEPQPSSAGAGAKLRISPELAAWMLATRRHIRAHWITPPEFREGNLQTELRVRLAEDGRVLGSPEVVRSSGNPFFDDNAVRAIRKASPLPRPPRAGNWPFVFTPEERG